MGGRRSDFSGRLQLSEACLGLVRGDPREMDGGGPKRKTQSEQSGRRHGATLCHAEDRRTVKNIIPKDIGRESSS